MVKRFEVETTKTNERYKYISEASGAKLYYATTRENPVISYSHKSGGKKKETEIALAEFIDVKGWKAMGNKLGEFKVLATKHISDDSEVETPDDEPDMPSSKSKNAAKKKKGDDDKYQPGDTIELGF